MPLGQVRQRAERQPVGDDDARIGQRGDGGIGLGTRRGIGKREAAAQRQDRDLPAALAQAGGEGAVVTRAAGGRVEVARQQQGAAAVQRNSPS
ncbi:MAG: hypothetical protein JNL85_05430 [Rubrivivax sp.]|nr:hypothetical protein [Rubrivivax sp.]